ncbi:MAG: DUF3352 domain-containing protein [Scytonema sp. PMC 1069.18]|nr:DUF3352 domain-containing protein [Scytonema sp. PMC 1069.18]MEC4883936.1 DUF3352 domain-containing protein [Scytonema sp. PMC 1070.18]
MPEKKSNNKFLLPALGAVVFVAGSIAAYLYLKGGPSGDISGVISAAKVVPDEALMATYISTDPKVWAKLEQFGTPEAQQLVTKELENLNKNLSPDNNISYEQDIKPWIGGVMIALLPPNPVKPAQSTPQAAQENNILMVVGIKDKIGALNFANKLKSQKDIKVQEIDYKGEKIIEASGKGSPTYTAVLNGTYIVFAPEKPAVQQAIDTFKGEPSFATKEGADSLLTRSVKLENTLAQVYVPDYPSMVKQLVTTNPQSAQLPPQSLAQLKQVKSMVAGVGVDDAGVRMKASANLDPQLVTFQYQNSSARVVSQLPTDTLALISGQGIKTWWSSVVEQSKDVPELKQTIEQARSQLQFIGLDLDKDVFGWMDREFGFAAIPSNQGVLAQVGFGGAFVFQTSDRKAAEATLNKLDTLVQAQSLKVAKRDIGGKEVTEWLIPQQGALLSHGWLNGDTVFIALGGPVGEAIANRKGQALDSSDSFKAATGSLQRPNSGYLYLDMDKTLALIDRFTTAQQQPIPPEAKTIMSSIHGLGVTATNPSKSISEVEMLLALKKK